MTDVQVSVQDGQPASDPVSGPSEPVTPETAEVVADAVETAADASVDVAAIEAERDVEIAQIQADTDRAAIEAAHDERVRNLEGELNECRTRIQDLEALNIDLQGRIQLTQQDTPQEQPTEKNLSEGEDSEVTPVSPEEVSQPPQEPERKKPRLRWI